MSAGKEIGALRFFWAILRPRRAAVAALVTLLIYTTYLATMSAEGFDEALALILLAQMLAASTGYRDRLVRGHFDGILAGRRSRVPLALAHAGLSLVPGLVLWLTFGVAQHFLTAQRSMSLTGGGLAAFVYASTVVWVVSLWLGRNTGGVLWLATLFVLAAAGQIHFLRYAYGTSSASLLVTARATGAALVFPLLMFSNGGYVEPDVLLGVCAAAAVALVAGVWTIARLDAPLRDPS